MRFFATNGRYDDFRQCGGFGGTYRIGRWRNEIAISAQEHAQGDVIALDDLGISVQLSSIQRLQRRMDMSIFIPERMVRSRM